MKRVAIFLCVLCGCLVSGKLWAQTATDEMEIIHSLFQTEKKGLVSVNMELTEEESRKFWPIYNSYQESLGKITQHMITLLNEYAQNYETMTDEKAESLIKEYDQLEKERLKLKNSILKKFKKVLPAKKVARYYQIENKIEIMVKNELVKVIPLVK